MKFGDRLHGAIQDVDQKGRGIFSFPLPQNPDETRTVVVPFTMPGDEIEATFTKRDQGQWVGALKNVTVPAPRRITPPCPHAGVCGGCLWQHMSYDAQIKLKQEKILQTFAQANISIPSFALETCSDPLFYRNRMDYVVGWRGELGLKAYGAWNRYIDLSTCLLLDKDTPEALAVVRKFFETANIEPWDAKHQTGQARYLVMRSGKFTGERLIMLVVKQASLITPAQRQAMVDALAPFATSLYLGENPDITDLSYAKTLELLHGKPYLRERINDLEYDIHPNAFFQTNSGMAAKLQTRVLERLQLSAGQRMLDLYCGMGFFGIACAKQGMNVFGQELDQAAIELAKHNAELNQVSGNTTFVAGAIESEDLWQSHAPDAVLIDPPRAGLHPNARATLIDKRPPRIVYVSCNYHNLIKDLPAFLEHYTLTHIDALDLFPQTPHVEVVATLNLTDTI